MLDREAREHAVALVTLRIHVEVPVRSRGMAASPRVSRSRIERSTC
jgi:hypothetical protein